MDCATNVFYVYIHRKKSDNEVFYVGKGKGKRAFSSHGRSKWWSYTAKKHGFTVEIVEKELSEESSFELEIELIKFYRDNNHPLVNMTDGGQGMSGNIASAETRAKLSAKFKGREISPEWRKKLSDARKGWIPSEETRQKLRECNLGKKLSKDVVDKIAEKNKRPVLCSNGMIFDSAKSAMVWLISEGLCPATRTYPTGISACCNGKRPLSYGFGWSHYKKENIMGKWVVKYDFGNVDGEELFDDEDEAHERYEELSEQAQDNDEAVVEIYQEEE